MLLDNKRFCSVPSAQPETWVDDVFERDFEYSIQSKWFESMP